MRAATVKSVDEVLKYYVKRYKASLFYQSILSNDMSPNVLLLGAKFIIYSAMYSIICKIVFLCILNPRCFRYFRRYIDSKSQNPCNRDSRRSTTDINNDSNTWNILHTNKSTCNWYCKTRFLDHCKSFRDNVMTFFGFAIYIEKSDYSSSNCVRLQLRMCRRIFQSFYYHKEHQFVSSLW